MTDISVVIARSTIFQQSKHVAKRCGLLLGGSTAEGLESQITKKLFLYAYYGAEYFGRGVTIDTNGKLIGYGFRGSSNSNNRTIQEGTMVALREGGAVHSPAVNVRKLHSVRKAH